MPGAVGAQLAVLAHDAELDREPEDVGDHLQRPPAVSTRRAASPARRLSSANWGSASRWPWPITSWIRSGSGV